MVKKIVLGLLSCLLLFCSTAFACNYTSGRMVTLEAVQQGSTPAVSTADFSEGDCRVRFAVKRENGKDTLVCLQLDRQRVLWSSEEDKVYGYHAYTVKQLWDALTGRYYYAVLCWYAMDATYKGYLLGFVPGTRQFLEYVNSRNLAVGDCGNVDFEAVNGKLYLCFFNMGGSSRYYKLNWDSEARGFDYVKVQEVWN